MPQPHLRSAFFGAGLVFVVLACAGPAAAVAPQRTFVSTGGVDNPTCSLAAPCRGFLAAVTAAAAGGEVIVLDSGGYGPVGIAKSITINAPKGVYAGISVLSGNGVDVNLAAGTDVVTLRGLTINGLGGAHGITFGGTGALRVIDSTVTGFKSGLNTGLTFSPTGASKLTLEGCSFDGNGVGIVINGGSGAFQTFVVIDRTTANDNNYGIAINDTVVATLRDSIVARSQDGITFDQTLGGTTTYFELIRTTLTQNSGKAVWAGDPTSGSGTSILLLRDSVLDRGAIGLKAGDHSSTFLSNSTISANTTGIQYGTTAVFVQSQGNNFIAGNGTNGTGGITNIGSN